MVKLKRRDALATAGALTNGSSCQGFCGMPEKVEKDEWTAAATMVLGQKRSRDETVELSQDKRRQRRCVPAPRFLKPRARSSTSHRRSFRTREL